MKVFVTASLLAVATLAMSQDDAQNHHYISAFFGKTVIMLGSSEVRFGGGISYAYGRLEPRFETKFATSQLVYEGYYDNTSGNGLRYPKDDSDAVGILAYGRWYARAPVTRIRPFFDLGWGFQYADRASRDLPSEINSTPVADLGIAIPFGKQQILASVRYLHISNAGFVSPNRGQNQLFLMASLSF